MLESSCEGVGNGHWSKPRGTVTAMHKNDIGPDPAARPDEHPLEGGQTEAVDEAQDDARHDAAEDSANEEAEASSTSATAARPGGGKP